MSHHIRSVVVLLATLLSLRPAALLGQATSQGLGLQHPNLERGFKPEKAYEVGDIDHVNLFNGNLSLTIPIGPSYRVGGLLSYQLTLVYNAKLWDWERWCDQTANGEACQNVPTANLDSNAGFGFQLGLGRLIPPQTFPRNPGAQWLYLSPDGGEHTFYDTLHAGDTPVAGTSYTRDSTYLRLRQLPSTLVELDEPGGLVRQFDRFGRLVHIRDHLGNRLTITRTANRWTLSDGHREHTIDFEDRPMDGRRDPQVSKVTLAAFGGRDAIYTFHYREQRVDRPCPFTPDLTSHPSHAGVSLLTAVVLPDDTRYSFSGYQLDDDGTLARCASMGALTEAQLPTYGSLAWEYGTYRFPNGGDRPGAGTGCTQPSQCGTPAFLQTVPGVNKRFMKRGSTTEGTWTYQPQLEFVPPSPPDNQPVQMTNTVVDPLGHETIHYFSTFQGGTPDHPAARRWHYGLPFTVRQHDGKGSNLRYLSRERFQGTNAKRQSFWVRYEEDGQTLSPPNAGLAPPHSNQRAASEMTRWHNELNADTWTKRSDFDGLGHYRRHDEGGRGYEGVSARTTFTNWNPRGRPAAHELWVLTTFDETWRKQGATTAKKSYCFGSGGFLHRMRVHAASNGTTGPNDIVVFYANDGRGNTKRERYYGAKQPISSVSNLCSFGQPASDAYRIEHTYAYGSLATSTYTDSAGTSIGFKSLDLTIDPNTGLASASRDTALLYTQYDYDPMGRLTTITAPPGGADLTYAYTLPSGTATHQRGWVTETHRKGASIYQQRRYVYDHWGRLWRSQERMPDGTWSTTQTERNILAWTTAVSVPTSLGSPTAGTPTRWTRYLGHDTFGRPVTIRPPDDDDAGGPYDTDIDLAYKGDREIRRTVRVRTNTGPAIQLTSAVTKEQYDRFGRLIRVTEPTAGAVATYAYDVGDRLITAKLVPVGGGTSQTRSFKYDQRGFLTRALHPEKGPGWVDYQDYDARGHAWTVKDNGHRLFYTFDRGERPTEVKESLGTGTRVLKAFTYCDRNDGPNKCLGKLETATRYNYVHAPWPGTPLITVPVTETYFYGGVLGRLSRRNTTVQMGDNDIGFTQSWSHDPQGRVTSTAYPCRTGFACATANNPERVVQRTYNQGRLRTIAGYATSISYHPSGLEHRVKMPNTLEITVEADPWGLPRPRNITLTGHPPPPGDEGVGAALEVTLGQHTYDGAGNLVQRGGEHYQFDLLSRLRRYAGTGNGYQDYRYDAYGNLTRIETNAQGVAETRTIAVQASTNRLVPGGAATYDSRGNLTSWGGNTYRYDGLNKMTAQDGTRRTFLYTPDDERIYTLHWDGDPREVWTLRDLDHTVLRIWETDGVLSSNWTWTKDYVYRSGKLHAAHTNQPFPTGKQYLVTDHLGSPRIVLDATRNVLETHHLLGYGEQLYEPPGARESKRFTGHERDWNDPGRGDDLDYMHARHYSPHLGRFWSVDPAAASIDPKLPQTWNRYSYGLGNPIKYVDPDGEAAVIAAALLGGAIDGGITIATNILTDRPILKGVGKSFTTGAAAGASGFGLVKVVGRGVLFLRQVKTADRIVYGGRGIAASSGTKQLQTARGNLLQSAQNSRLKNAIRQLFRKDAAIGNGGTADAIRHELRTGQLLSPKGHYQKGVEMRTSLLRIIRREDLSTSDRQIAKSLMRDLQNALSKE